MKPYSFHPDAEAEADAAFEYYWIKDPAAAFAFGAELRGAYRSLRTRPLICPPYLHGARRVILNRYPFSVVFRERLHDIQIVAVAHAKRRPGYWAKRVKQ
ncbi:MAG: type II toxin-antitoxin system RelE/ParE family toxin [Terracidiphilus sp.]|jgi:plasmid stabilization system protein ParE